jgi:hypothetical protein
MIDVTELNSQLKKIQYNAQLYLMLLVDVIN